MKVISQKGLEFLAEKTGKKTDEILQKREELGLSNPEDFNVHLELYGGKTGGYAHSSFFPPKVVLNLLFQYRESAKQKDAVKLDGLFNYFNLTRSMSGTQGEEYVLMFINNPLKALDDARKHFKSSEEFFSHIKKYGLLKNSYKKRAKEHANAVRKSIEYFLPKIKKFQNNVQWNILRHEVDHIDFFASFIHQEYIKKRNFAYDLRKKVAEGDLSLSKKCAKANMEYLKSFSDVNTLLEPRAMFFEHLNFKDILKTDFEKTKRNIINVLHKSYIEVIYSEEILDCVISNAWARGEMNKETSDYLYHRDHAQTGNHDELRYDIKMNKVNFDFAQKVWYEDVAKWKGIFAKKAILATEAIEQAYKSDPSKLAKANNAKSFEEYISICK